MFKRFFSLIIIICLIGLFFPVFFIESNQGWYDPAWKYRKKITIDHTEVSNTDQSNFPVLINTTSSDWKDTSNGGYVGQSDGGDILFTSSDGTTKLDHEIERYTPSTGELIAWVEIPTVSVSTDTVIYIYYGNSSSANQWNINGVWDNSDFENVYHFEETSGNYLDSTVNANNSTAVSVNSRTATGKIGYAPDFLPASSNRIAFGASYTLGDVTQEAWINLDLSGTRPITQHAASGETEATNIVYGLETDTSNNLWQQWEYGAGTNVTNSSTATVTLDTLTYVVAVKDTTNNQVIWYINGAAAGSATSYTNEATGGTSGVLYVGGRITSAQWFDGVIDELRISHSIRSADWIATSYNSQNSPATFYSIGSQQYYSGPSMYSSNYLIKSSSLNVGGHLQTSDNYIMRDTIGEVATGIATSDNYRLYAGYQQMQEVYLSITSPANVDMGTLGGLTGGTATGDATWTVKTDNAAGFLMSIKASQDPAMQGAIYTITNYTEAALGTPDYAWSIAATASEFGYTVEPATAADAHQLFKDDGSSTCNTGANQTANQCWLSFTTSDVTVINRSSRTSTSGEAEKVKFQVEIGSSGFKEEGTYQATVTVTVVTN